MEKLLELLEQDCTMSVEQMAMATGIPLEDAAYAASTAPAKRIGLTQTGCIQVGNCADLIVLDEKLELRAVFIDGVPQQIKQLGV